MTINQIVKNQMEYVKGELNRLESALVSVSDQIENINGDITTRGLSVHVDLIGARLSELQKTLSDTSDLMSGGANEVG